MTLHAAALERPNTLPPSAPPLYIAEIDRRAGRLDKAEAGYRAALDLYRRISIQPRPVPVANLALVYVERGAWAEAWEILEGCIASLRATGRLGWLGVVIGLALPTVVDRPELWDALLAERVALRERTGHADRDVTRMLLLAADRWEAAGDATRRRAALEAARAEAQATGMPAEAAAIDTLLAP